MNAQLIGNTPRCLICGADETMLTSIKKGKTVVPESVKQVIDEGLPDMPHVTAMCAHTILGKAHTLYYFKGA